MSDDRRLVAQLERFGLTEKEAAVYLALVDRGEAKPPVVASDADVSVSYVYQVCERLETEGLVTVNDHRTPTTMRARPPSETLRARIDRMHDALEAVERRYDRPTDDMESLEVLRARAAMYERLRGHVESADDELFVSVPLAAVRELADALRDAVDRGVLVLLAVGAEAGEVRSADVDGVATAVRRRVGGTTVYVSADMTRGVVAPASVLGWDHGESEGVSYGNLTVAVAVESAFLGTTWPMAEEVLLRRPSPLPRTYRTIRPATYDATLHRRAGRTVRAEVEARPARTRVDLDTWDPDGATRRSLVGTVVGTRQCLVDPPTGEFALENELSLATGDGTVRVGGRGAFREDYEAVRVTLRGDDGGTETGA
ncbi:TrmB family transcriptional regulator sugar-binding domain-containing protein [Candidatus Halobonum tyrrellensis]|uniref:Transcription regulator n=1 Tax=Candidatus Halobonum tyrrellensis G22 TaxID=1324957 RepID=V4GUP3_9EURY|nr:TrmB family transcriptional regulator sugar-binding domain-containing protein [Candidatus Halobonum tyrrellensis]ESP88836.1 transcription regulator [Candidatus Halobonum tyrrellensis G22]